MKRRRELFSFAVLAFLSVIVGSAVFACHEIDRLTGNAVLYQGWVLLCLICQLPLVLVPLDQGKTLGFLVKHIPQPGLIFFISWNLAQILTLLLFPVFLLLPSGGHIYDYLQFLVVFLVALTAFRSAYRVVENRINFVVPGLPSDWKPLTILHLSDIHSGPFMRPKHLDKIVERINAKAGFDLCVVTGDVVNHSADEIPWTVACLEKIRSPLGTFAALGNHEYIDDEKKVVACYANSKVKLLLDSSHFLSAGNRKIRLIGVDFPFEENVTGVAEIEKALGSSLKEVAVQSDELRVLLSHHPDGFDAAKAVGIPVTLAGHTHGGQVEVFGVNFIRPFVHYIRGVYKDNLSFMYVNSGLGNWMPFRVNVPCEYALITISVS